VSAAPDIEITRDRYLGGRVVLDQPANGYRAGIDAALLAASLDLKPGASACEFGCGAGAALFSAAAFYPETAFTGIEADPEAAALARSNAALNAAEARVEIIEGDALSLAGRERFDAVFFNPPFFDDPAALRPPAPGKTRAWMADAPLADWIGAGLKALKAKGALTLIHRADRLGEALAALDGRAGVAVLPIHPRTGRSAKRVLIRAVKGSRAPLALLYPFFLHGEGAERYLPEAGAVLAGRALISMSS
jgi:tRNA1(Val) A37 N6-methylase TrmN6